LRRKRISIERRVGRIGFLGKGLRMPSHERSDVASALSFRIDEDSVVVRDIERERYRDDLTLRPEILRGIFSRKPDAIVMAETPRCVADTLDVCIEERTAAVPRGAGTAGLGGAIPVRGGVVVVTSGLKQVLSVDRAALTVSVEAGCTWKALQERLNGEGLSLLSYPTSGATSTIGGWMSTGGFGIGTLAAGSFHRQVQAMEVALPSGILVTSKPGEGRYGLQTFAGTEGQMGIITKLTFPVKRYPERTSVHLLRPATEHDGYAFLKEISALERRPFCVKMVCGGAVDKRLASDCSVGCFILVVNEGEAGEVEAADRAIGAVALRSNLEMDDPEQGRETWSRGFDDARHASGMLAGEILIEIERIPDLVSAIEGTGVCPRGLSRECQVVDHNTALMVFTLAGDAGYGDTVARDVFATGYIVALGIGMGARPYGTGLWNTAYARYRFGEQYRQLRGIKREIDRLNLMNPGKFFSMSTARGLLVPGFLYRLLAGRLGKGRIAAAK
jgi:glycolate oxidase